MFVDPSLYEPKLPEYQLQVNRNHIEKYGSEFAIVTYWEQSSHNDELANMAYRTAVRVKHALDVYIQEHPDEDNSYLVFDSRVAFDMLKERADKIRDEGKIFTELVAWAIALNRRGSEPGSPGLLRQQGVLNPEKALQLARHEINQFWTKQLINE